MRNKPLLTTTSKINSCLNAFFRMRVASRFKRKYPAQHGRYNMSQDKDNALVVFQNKKIRRIWHDHAWFFSVIDVIQALTDSTNPRNYWSMLKKRELAQEIDLSTFCVQLKLPSADGKFYETDCANTKSLFRLIQSVPSRKAEPFKLWLAQVGYERVEE